MRSTLRTSSYLLVIAAALGAAHVFVKGPQGFTTVVAARERVKTLQEENAALRQQNERTRERIQALRNSKSEQELAVREGPKLLRKGEVSFILPEDKK